MGGSALSIPTRRITAQEFRAISHTIAGTLQMALPGARIAVVPSYRSKPDFGDIDIMVERESVTAAGGPARLEDLARSEWRSRASFRNNSVLSVEYRRSDDDDTGCQVDLITAPRAEFDFHLNYLSYNDLGNFIGRVAHRMGFSYGQSGLLYFVREADRVFAKLAVTLDTSVALTFLGYDPERFARGFDTLEEVFEYTASSRYFAPELYLLENRNHIARTRDRKRKSYRAFLEWLAQGHGAYAGGRHQWADRDDESAVATERLALLLDARRSFPDFAVAVCLAQERLRVAKLVKGKFNGSLVMGWTGLSGKALGDFMQHLRGQFASIDHMNAWVLAQSTADVQAWVQRQADSGSPAPRSVTA